MGLLTHADSLEADAVDLYATIAHGEGGLAKVQSAVSKLGKLIGDAASGVVPQIPVPASVAAAHTDAKEVLPS